MEQAPSADLEVAAPHLPKPGFADPLDVVLGRREIRPVASTVDSAKNRRPASSRSTSIRVRRRALPMGRGGTREVLVGWAAPASPAPPSVLTAFFFAGEDVTDLA